MHHGIEFTSKDNDKLQSFLKFPIDHNRLLALTDANWGPQDQSKPSPSKNDQLDLFKSRSLSGYLLWLGGPLHWSAKRQAITARSSAEAEIYATDECVKNLLCIQHLINDTDTKPVFQPTSDPIKIFNENNACVCWSKSTTSEGL